MKTLKKRNRQFAEIMERAAEQLLVSRQTISNWENGKSLPDILSIVRMSELYGLSLDELIKGDEGVMKKIERETRAAQAEKKIIKFAWISIVSGAVLMILGEIFEGNPVVDFVGGALPWVLLGVMFLSAILYLNQEEK